MSTLAEVQLRFRNAVVQGDTWHIGSLASLLIGGRSPEKRLIVHQRNYRQSLVDVLLIKFPATGWLLGTQLLTEAATRFIREYPPQAPCIAEFGDGFPDFLSQCPAAVRAPYVREFAELEWYVGKVAIAVSSPPRHRRGIVFYRHGRSAGYAARIATRLALPERVLAR